MGHRRTRWRPQARRRRAGRARAGAAGAGPGAQGLGRRRRDTRPVEERRSACGGHPDRTPLDRGRAALMPGNSRNPSRRVTAKKSATVGSGGRNRAGLKGRGRTLPADERPWHKGYSGTEKLPEKTARKQDRERRAAAAEGRTPKVGIPGTKDTTWGRGGRAAPKQGGRVQPPRGPRVAPGRRSNPTKEGPELLLGRNPVVEALRAAVPATALYVAQGIDIDDRVAEIVRGAGDRGIPILEIGRNELDRMTGGVLHQGVGLQVPPFAYENFDDLLAAALEQAAPLLVALDGVTDPRNVGAVIRSVAAFGGHGVFMTQRRAARGTAAAGGASGRAG